MVSWSIHPPLSPVQTLDVRSGPVAVPTNDGDGLNVIGASSPHWTGGGFDTYATVVAGPHPDSPRGRRLAWSADRPQNAVRPDATGLPAVRNASTPPHVRNNGGDLYFGGLRVSPHQWRRIIEIFGESNDDEAMKKTTGRTFEEWEDFLDKDSKPVGDAKSILAPLDTVFLPAPVMNASLRALGVPELLNGRAPTNRGAVFRGPAGTGKTILLRAVAKAYENAGCVALECNLAQITGPNVGMLAKALDSLFQSAVKEINKTGKPVFIFFDEADSAVTKADRHGSVASYFQDAINVMKKYIGNYPQLVVAISTNADTESFDDAVIREGRLQVITVGYPGLDEKKKMWKHFLSLNGLMDSISDTEAEALAKAVPDSMGAQIEDFCRNYLDFLAEREVMTQGHASLLEFLKAGNDWSQTRDQGKSRIGFEQLLADVVTYTRQRTEAKGPVVKKNRIGYA